MKVRIAVRRVEQHVRVDDNHSTPVHDIIERIAVGDIDQRLAAPRRGQRLQLWLSSTAPFLKEEPQCCFDQFRHGPSRAGRFLA